MMLAVCAKCGAERAKPHGKCAGCGYQPRSVHDRARALYLSHGAFTQEQRKEHPEWVPEELPLEQLREIAMDIKAGKPHVFDQSRLNKLLAQHAAISQVAPLRVFGGLLRFFAPALLLIAGFFIAARILRTLQ